MRIAGTKLAANHQYRGFGDQLYDLSGQRPSLDLNFSSNKSLIDSASGQNLVDFTRASSGTYVGSDGLIKTATTNLLLQSEEFGTTWTLGTTTLTENDILAPNGTQTADKFETTGSASAFQSITKAASAVTYTGSVFVKSSLNSFTLAVDDGTTTNRGRCVFDISAGTLTSTNNDGNFTATTGSIVSYPNGWYRLIVTTTSNTQTTARLRFFGGDFYHAWGAQLEQSTTVGEYIPTTSTINSAPRFDHDPTTGESLGLLVEESRTNLLLQSENFSTTWTLANTTVSTNQIVAPDGLTTADKIVEAATTTEHNIRQDTASQSTGTYTISIFAKAGERSNLQFVATGILGGFRANFDLANGVLGSVDAQLTASIRPYPNGWYRCIVTATSSTSGALRAQWNIVTSSTAARVESYAGDITKGLFLWGCVVEAGAFPTSYIATTTATVTRSADVASISGSNFSSWYRQDEGTVFATYIIPALANGTISSFDDTTVNNRWQQRFTTNGQRYRLQASGVSLLDSVDLGAPNVNTSNKIAQVLRAGDQRYSAHGSLNAIAFTAATLPVVTQLQFGTGPGSDVSGRILIGRLTYWPQRLPNETLQTITQ